MIMTNEEFEKFKKEASEEMVTSYISNYNTPIDNKLKESEKRISNLFYFDDDANLYTLDKVILYVGINSKNKDVEISLVYENGEKELFDERAFYQFIELKPKFIYREVRHIKIIDFEKGITHYLSKMDSYSVQTRYSELWRINVEKIEN